MKDKQVIIKIDFASQKELDLAPPEKKKRARTEEYDYDDDFMDAFEGDEQLVDIECKLENFFIYKGEIPDEPRRIVRKYKTQIQKDENNEFEFENKLSKIMKKDAKFHNLTYFWYYQEIVKAISVANKEIQGNTTGNSATDTENITNGTSASSSIDEEMIVAKLNELPIPVRVDLYIKIEIMRNINRMKLPPVKKKLSYDVPTEEEMLARENAAKVDNNVASTLNASGEDEEPPQVPLFLPSLAVDPNDVEEYLKNKKKSINTLYDQLKIIITDTNNYSKGYRHFNFKTGAKTGATDKNPITTLGLIKAFISDYILYYYADQSDTVRSRVVAILQKIFPEECTNWNKLKYHLSQEIQSEAKGYNWNRLSNGYITPEEIKEGNGVTNDNSLKETQIENTQGQE